MRFSKEHRRVLEAMNSGMTLKPAGSGFFGLDGGYVLYRENEIGLGFNEVMTSTVKYLQSMGYLQSIGETMIITNDGIKRILRGGLKSETIVAKENNRRD